MSISHRRLAAILGMSALLASCFLVLPPIRQDPGYHHFADARTLLGIPNFWNVISNLPFLLAAAFGLRAIRSPRAFIEPWERIAYGVLLAGTLMVGAGSTYYHLRPDNGRLFWDRLR